MPLFTCTKCGCVENTALCNFWIAQRDGEQPTCSGCDPKKGATSLVVGWHGQFPQRKPEDLGLVEYTDDFLYDPVKDAAWTKRMGLKPKKKP
jgi:hypothetical protein